MRIRLIGVFTLSTMLAAGTAIAADATKPAEAGASSSSSTTTTTTGKSGAAKEMMTHTGVVKSFDDESHMLTLKDGSQFMLDPSLKGEELKADKAVKLSYKTEGTKKIVTDYEIETKS